MMNAPLPRLDDTNLSIDQLDPKLIRQVLLTDPSKFHLLHLSNAPRNTPSFDEFQRDEIESTTSMEAAMKRAFRDHIIMASSQQQGGDGEENNLQPLIELVLQLHHQLRSLVPNRHDLHTVVDDDAVRLAESVETLLPLLLHASEGLESLESKARADTTAEWRRQAKEVQETTNTTTLEFVVASTLYLLYKTELCQADKQDFYLQHIWAPRIHTEGPQYLRSLMETEFGSEGYPLTMTWINELVENHEGDLQELNESESARRALIAKGWVQTILFRKDQATVLPEILAGQDIQLIRHVCARAVAGCALALHAAATNTAVLSQRIEPTSPVGLRKADLIQAMSSNNRSATYEDCVSDAVVALSKAWSSSTPDESSLRSRTVAVLRGEDPVTQLLDRRMQEVFADILTHREVSSTAQLVMRSGMQESSCTKGSNALGGHFEESFCSKGLSFYAPELATLSVHAKKIIDLAWLVHQELIEKTIQECIKTH